MRERSASGEVDEGAVRLAAVVFAPRALAGEGGEVGTGYVMVMAGRARQLAERHEQAVQRAAAHSEAWHRKQANRRLFY